MNYGLYMASSGAIAGMYRMDVLANNLANSETPGFKPVMASLRQRDAARVEDGLFALPSNELLERLGAGVMAMPNRVNLRQGSIQTTGQPLDLAIQGDGFFSLAAPANAPQGSPPVRLSRDGRFTLTARGQLVQASSGLPLLDAADRPITLRSTADLTIHADGRIVQAGQEVAKIALTTIPNTAALLPEGSGLFTAPTNQLAARTPATGQITSKALERSAADPIRTITDLSAAERSVGSSVRLIQLHDQLLDRAINAFGRVA
jgi:flagellar basal-body rod protein FlgG